MKISVQLHLFHFWGRLWFVWTFWRSKSMQWPIKKIPTFKNKQTASLSLPFCSVWKQRRRWSRCLCLEVKVCFCVRGGFTPKLLKRLIRRRFLALDLFGVFTPFEVWVNMLFFYLVFFLCLFFFRSRLLLVRLCDGKSSSIFKWSTNTNLMNIFLVQGGL